MNNPLVIRKYAKLKNYISIFKSSGRIESKNIKI